MNARPMILNWLNEQDYHGVQENSRFVEDLGMDSLDLLELVTYCQDKFGVRIESKELKTLLSVGDLLGYVEAREIH